MRIISVTNGARLRFAAKPSHEPATAHDFADVPAHFHRAAIVSIDVFVPRTTSHSFITFAGAKKCAPATSSRSLGHVRHDVDVDADELVSIIAPGFMTASSFVEHVFLHVYALEYRFDHDVAIGDVVVAPHRMDERQTLVHLLLRDTAALHADGVVVADALQAFVERFLRDFQDLHGTPKSANDIAMPPPMVPAPTIAALLTRFGSRSFGTPGIFATSRSAKNA